MRDNERMTEFRFFTVPQWQEEEAYLRRRHQQGWRFDRLTGLGHYHFVACRPEDVVYQLDYNPLQGDDRRQYLQMFADCGWEYLQDYAGYSYFRKPVAAMQDGDEEIFCDDASRMEMIRRVFRGRMVPLLIMFFCCILPQLGLSLYRLSEGAYRILDTVLLVTYGSLFSLYLVLFCWFGYQYRKLEEKLKK